MAYDEYKHGADPRTPLPQFGDESTSYCLDDDIYRVLHADPEFAKPFYDFWNQFTTRKDFSWVVVVQLSGPDLLNADLRAYDSLSDTAPLILIRILFPALRTF